MKLQLEKVIFINRAPFDKLEVDFNENEISVLTATNGKGKTTILSHIVDAFYEIARPHFPNEFENKELKFYRLSSSIHSINMSQPSFVYMRFRTTNGTLDYVDIRNKCSEEEYNKAINIENKVSFDNIKRDLEDANYCKMFSPELNKGKAEDLFNKNILTYFPSYRHEAPGYLNDPYQIKLDFKKKSDFAGYLKNPIEVISGLPQLANWMMDIVIDLQYKESNSRILKQNIDRIITDTFVSKRLGELRYGVGPRGTGGIRLQILKSNSNETIYPSIFNLSSGEVSIICLFGEILRQADKINNNISLAEITGIVLIDEVEKHLHIKLQKEILPKLFNLFPNIQFIVSSHSPFLNLGLAEKSKERTKIINLDNMGISTDPTENELYTEVYNLMISENERYKEMYQSIKQKIAEGTNPLIITEGKTDIKHIKRAKEKLNIQDCEIDYFVSSDGEWGDSKLKMLLEQLSKVPISRKIIGIFDRDVAGIVSDIEKENLPFKNYGNDVYAFCIPTPKGRENYINISIEFYYPDKNIKKEKDGKCLYFENEIEFRQSASNKKDRTLVKLDAKKMSEEFSKKVFDENIGELDWIHSKARFADLIESDEIFISDFEFTNFNLIFDKIKEIANSQT